MQQTDKAFTGSIPALYEKHMVPMFFAPFALDMAARLRGFETARVLEVAAGTGVVTRELAKTLPPHVEIVATDLNPAMLEIASRTLDDARVSWRPADASSLPFEDHAFDAVICQFGAMFFPDKSGAFREARRVLREGGRYIFNVWGSLERNEFDATVTEAVASVFPQDPPLFFPRTPHGYHDVGRIRRDLQNAGFERIETESLERVSEADTPMEVAIALCQGTPLRAEIEARGAARLQEATEATARLLSERFGDGPVRGRMQAIIITAFK